LQSHVQALDAPFVDPEYSVRAALAFEVGLQVIPSAKKLAAICTGDGGVGGGMGWYSQPDGPTEGAFQLMIEIVV
jgi:hypothetical protein